MREYLLSPAEVPASLSALTKLEGPQEAEKHFAFLVEQAWFGTILVPSVKPQSARQNSGRR